MLSRGTELLLQPWAPPMNHVTPSPSSLWGFGSLCTHVVLLQVLPEQLLSSWSCAFWRTMEAFLSHPVAEEGGSRGPERRGGLQTRLSVLRSMVHEALVCDETKTSESPSSCEWEASSWWEVLVCLRTTKEASSRRGPQQSGCFSSRLALS